MTCRIRLSLGFAVALAVAVWLPWAASADWVTYGGNASRTGLTSEAVLPPLSVAWKYATDPGHTYHVSPVIVGEMLFWAAGTDLVAMQAETAAPVWKFTATDGVNTYRIRTTPAYADGTLYFGADNGVFYALDAETGEQKWYLQTERAIRSSPAVLEGVVYFGNNDAKVYAVEAQTGKVKWVFQAGDDVYAPITVTRNTVWVACTDSALYGVDARRGLERWQVPFTGAGGLYLAPVAEGRVAYLPVRDSIYRISASGVARLVGDPLPSRITAPLALSGRYLYVGCRDGSLAAYDPSRGRLRWTYPCSGAIEAQPLIAGGLVVAGGSGGEVVAVDAERGTLRWSYGEWAPWAPKREVPYRLMAAAASGGALYLSWDDGNLARLAPGATDVEPPLLSRFTPQPGSPANPVSSISDLTVGANVYDEGSGVAPSAVTMTVDGDPLALTRRTSGDYYAVLQGSKAAPALPDGWHTVVLSAEDQRGNKVARTWTFLTRAEAAAPAGEPVTPGIVGETERF